MIEFLVDRKPQVNLESLTDKGWSPIHLLCNYGKYNTIKKFLFENVNLTRRVKIYDGNTRDFNVIDLLGMNHNLTPEQEEELTNIINDMKQYSRLIDYPKKLKSKTISELNK